MEISLARGDRALAAFRGRSATADSLNKLHIAVKNAGRKTPLPLNAANDLRLLRKFPARKASFESGNQEIRMGMIRFDDSSDNRDAVIARLRQRLTQKKDGVSPLHDIATGALEGGLVGPFTEPIYSRLLGHPPKPLMSGGIGKFGKGALIGAGLGAVTTGVVGAGLSALKRRKSRTDDGADMGGYFERLVPGMIEFGGESVSRESLRTRRFNAPRITSVVAGAQPSRSAAASIFLDSRPRNNDGQFEGAETAGADPNSMAAAYGPQTISNRRNLIATGAATAAGGIAGNLATPAVKRGISATASRLRGLASAV